MSISTWSVPAVEEWRATARKAARQLGEPIRTGITAEGTRVWATLLRPVTDADLQAAARVLDELFAGAKTNARTDGIRANQDPLRADRLAETPVDLMGPRDRRGARLTRHLREDRLLVRNR